MKIRRFSLAAILTAVASFVGVVAFAASTVVVTPTNPQGWSTADTRPGGTVAIVQDATAPSGGNGSLRLTTNNTNEAKAQYMRATDAPVPIDDVTNLSYWTKQVSGPAEADPSYQLVLCLNGVDANGVCQGFTTLVYEPYWNDTLADPVTQGEWQQWEVDAGQLWSSKTVSCSNGGVVNGAGGAPFYTLEDIETMCPSAVAVGFGVNIGTFNQNYDVHADLVTFNDVTYDFEFYSTPADKAQCKNGGWATFNPNRPAGPFKNQGDCVSYMSNGK